MAKTLIGIVTFGNLEFTKLTIKSFIDTTKNDIDIFVVVGKPDDFETIRWLATSDELKNVGYIIHRENKGFPASLNDIYDYAWIVNDYDNLILAGNDVVVYPHAVDSLIDLANSSEYCVISGLQYDVKSLVKEFPETSKYFSGSTFQFTDFASAPWEKFTKYNDEQTIADMQLYDIQNLCLYKRKVFDVIGYTDVNFYPAYYVDNDYARRIVVAGLPCCSLVNARFFHFWSRTIHQGSGGSTSKYFENNRRYYISKWGGDFGKETKIPEIRISSRDMEAEIINYWRR